MVRFRSVGAARAPGDPRIARPYLVATWLVLPSHVPLTVSSVMMVVSSITGSEALTNTPWVPRAMTCTPDSLTWESFSMRTPSWTPPRVTESWRSARPRMLMV